MTRPLLALLLAVPAGALPLEPGREAAAALFEEAAARPWTGAAAVDPPPEPPSSPLSPGDLAFLDELGRREFSYFWERADPETGFVADRAPADGSPRRGMSSVAATGFGLASLCVAAERGWIERDLALERARRTLRSLLTVAAHERGWLYHFIDMGTGARMPGSEASSIDTALLLAGALTARQCFGDAEAASLASSLYERVDFPWMLRGGLFSHGWTPERGFLPSRWDGYSEHMVLALLAIGSPSRPVPAGLWQRWRRGQTRYAGRAYFAGASPLFIHQYSHAFVDFRGLRDRRGIDYHENSVRATLAHREFFQRRVLRERYGYGPDEWGLTSSDGPDGYRTWGAPAPAGSIDGTVVPSAAGGSLMFTPEESVDALRAMSRRPGVLGRYGLADAYNPSTGWIARDALGIDQGITLLSAENARDGLVWSWFMRNPEVARAMREAGFRPAR